MTTQTHLRSLTVHVDDDDPLGLHRAMRRLRREREQERVGHHTKRRLRFVKSGDARRQKRHEARSRRARVRGWQARSARAGASRGDHCAMHTAALRVVFAIHGKGTRAQLEALRDLRFEGVALKPRQAEDAIVFLGGPSALDPVVVDEIRGGFLY